MRAQRLALATLVLVTLAGCGGGPHTVTEIPPTTDTVHAHGPLRDGDWPTYHHDNARTGTASGLSPLGTLRQAWRTRLDGAVYGQPLVVGGAIVAATENDTVYALDPGNGRITWRRHLGTPVDGSDLPCGNIDPLGITGTMAYDEATSRVFALAETTGGAHTLYGLDVHSGKVDVRVPLEPPKGEKIAHQQRAALTVLGDRVYVAYGGLNGDCANYVGSVVSMTTAGTEPRSYAVPTVRAGGIWAPAGAVVDGDRLLYAVGNGESTHSYDGSDSVIALTPQLRRVDVFAPSSWPSDNAGDLDLGSSSPTLLGPWVFVAGERGTGYVLHHDAFGGIGGEVTQLAVCRSFGGSAVDGGTAYLPCLDGTRALTIDANGTARVRWQAPVAAAGSPVVGGGAVWVVDYQGGVLYALDPGTGSVRAKLDIGECPHFASPTLSGSHAYIGTMRGVVAVAGA